MAIHFSDELERLFPNWLPGRRESLWMWCYLQARGAGDLGNFDSNNMRSRLAGCISQFDFVAEINDQIGSLLLPDQAFDWIEKIGRQPAFVLKCIQERPESSQVSISVFPFSVTAREKIVLFFDLWGADKSYKQFMLNELKARWVKQQRDDKQLSWYASAGKERQKCELAWQWYQEHHQLFSMHATVFSRLDDILEFLDGTPFRQDERLYHMGQIKKKFKAQQTKENRQGKTQTNISLSVDARRQLDELARHRRQTKTEVIEQLIRDAFGQPHAVLGEGRTSQRDPADVFIERDGGSI